MTTESVTITANIPDIDDFAACYRNFGNLARGQGRFLFDLIMSAESFNKAQRATLDHHVPAVQGVAEDCFQIVQTQAPTLWNDNLKRFIGAAVCCLMEANGFKKTGTKKAIAHKAFTKGEFYQL